MQSPPGPRVAFVGWNPFQFLHFASVAERLPGSTYIIEKRSAAGIYDFDSLPGHPAAVLHLDRREMRRLDGRFDVLVCQTPFAGIEEIAASRLAMLQYGYAKEAHNFAPWRAFADLALTFGDYASRKLDPYCPSAATGNPRYAKWCDPSFRRAARGDLSAVLDPAKKTVLYAPTWGGLSSFPVFSDAVRALSANYNVILKIHHNSQLAGEIPEAAAYPIVRDVRHDIVSLLAAADVMLSDHSGAIFDALFCEVPVVLLDPPEKSDSINDSHSIERARRCEIGPSVTEPAALAATVAGAIGRPPAPALQAMRADLFADPANAPAAAAEALTQLALHPPPRTQPQDYIRAEMRRFYRCRAELTAARTFGGFLKMTAREIRKRLPN